MPIGEVDPSFLQEVWVLYAIGVAILVMRFAVRLKAVGIRGLQGDDAFAFLVLVMYTIDAITVHLVYYAGTNVEAAVIQTTRTLTDDEIADYTYGSKIELVAWYSYTALIWCLKGTMLCFFKRMTTGLWQARLVKWFMYACIVSYVAVFFTITFGCFPTEKNWQVVPDPGLKCTFKMQNFLVSAVLNVITDAAILCIPLPLLWTLQVTLRKKVVIGLLLCSGLFVIAAAIIRVVLTLGAHPSALNVNRWGVRETIVGILTVNIPILRPIMSRHFWTTGQVSNPSNMGGKTSHRYGGATTARQSTALGGAEGPYEMAPSISDSRRKPSISDNDSEDYFPSEPAGAVINRAYNTSSPSSPRPGTNDVVIHTMYHVTSEENPANRQGDAWGYDSGTTRTMAYGGSSAV